MVLAVLALSIVIAVVGAVGIVVPTSLLTVAELFTTPVGFYVAAALRLVLGTAVVLAAPTSGTPTTLRVLGVVIIVGGLVTPLFGVERARMIVAWWATQGSAFMRVWAVVALVLGVFLAYATAPHAPRRRQGSS
jgi:hypothetical protein